MWLINNKHYIETSGAQDVAILHKINAIRKLISSNVNNSVAHTIKKRNTKKKINLRFMRKK